MGQKKRRVLLVICSSLLFGWLSLPIALAATPYPPQYTSTNYGVNEVTVGSGGVVGATSPNYSTNVSVGGAFAGGNPSSPDYQVFGGFNTSDAPYLQFIVNSSSIDVGYLSVNSTTTATGTFSIRAWNSGGYTVVNASPPPQNGIYTLNPITVAAAATPGTPQFGINLRANTSPTTFGADPVQSPDSSFSHGQVASGYNTPNEYQYNNGDTIAYSTKSSSITIFTISYIFNISTITPDGQYTFTHVMVATPTY
jgi:hypothetical protein